MTSDEKKVKQGDYLLFRSKTNTWFGFAVKDGSYHCLWSKDRITAHSLFKMFEKADKPAQEWLLNLNKGFVTYNVVNLTEQSHLNESLWE